MRSNMTLQIFFIGLFLHVVLKEIQADSLHFQEQTSTPKLSMNIFYETLCPDSRRFITGTFYPIYKTFSHYLDVHFIPFGKGSINVDGSDHQCQHGPEECINNLIHGCALYVLAPGNEQVEFVKCGMLHKSIDGQKMCTQERGLTWSEIQKCANGKQGVALALVAQNITYYGTNGGPAFIPTIVFNNVSIAEFMMIILNLQANVCRFSLEDQEVAFQNPSIVICKYLPSIPPCKSTKQLE